MSRPVASTGRVVEREPLFPSIASDRYSPRYLLAILDLLTPLQSLADENHVDTLRRLIKAAARDALRQKLDARQATAPRPADPCVCGGVPCLCGSTPGSGRLPPQRNRVTPGDLDWHRRHLAAGNPCRFGLACTACYP